MIDVAVVGAGPYGLACASHLRAAGRDIAVFGDPMASWRDAMPAGMLLRSPWEASTISDPHGALTLDAYEATLGRRLDRPVPVEDFVAYGQWFARHGVDGALDVGRRVAALAPVPGGFRVELDDGVVRARRVVVATGIAAFPHLPAHLSGVGDGRVLHSGDVVAPASHAGERIAVVGAGQSAVELAALLAEAGAVVTLVARAGELRWLRRSSWLHNLPRPLLRTLYPPSDVGPPGLNRLAAAPELMRHVPERARDRVAQRCIRPAAAGWLADRVGEVELLLGREVRHIRPVSRGLELDLSDGSRREIDRLVLATGYRLDADRLGFLTPEVRRRLRLRGGSPLLGPGFESTVAGLHFVGAFSAASFGPVMRFVSGTWFTAAPLTRHVARATPARGPRAARRPAATAPAPTRPAPTPTPAAAARPGRPGGAVVLGMTYRALEIVRSLGRRGVPIVVARTDEHSLAAHSRYAGRRIDLRGDELEQRDRLLALDAPGWALLASGDEEALLLARQADALGERYVVASPPWEQLRGAYDKRALHAIGARAGLPQPATAFADAADPAHPPAPPAPFPLAIKPAQKVGRNALNTAKAWRVDGPAELAERWAAAAALVADPALLMLQELVPGDEQLSFAALCRDGEVEASLTARRVRQWPREFGRASTYVVTIDDPAVERDARRVLAALGLTGLVEVEFKRDARTGKNMLLDVNARAWGWLSLGAQAGVDFPWLLWRQLHGARAGGLRARPGVRWVRMATDVQAAAAELRAGVLSPRAYARSLRPPHASAVLAGDDLSPALVDVPLLVGIGTERLRRG